jgi:integrase
MPKLRVVQRVGRGTFYVRGTVRGQSVYESTGTDRRADAEAYAARREQELWTQAVFGARAVVTFATAVASYLTAERRAPGQAVLVGKLLDLFGPLRLSAIDQVQLDRAYGILLRPDPSPATKLRNVLTPLRAILEHAARRGWCDRPAFEVPRQPKPRVAILLPGQATALVRAAAPHLRPLIVFIIGTLARMSEALELHWGDVDLDGARVVFRRTKGGVERHVDLVPTVLASLAALRAELPEPPAAGDRVFRPRYARRKLKGEAGQQWQIGTAYRDTRRQSGGQIKTAWAAACRRAALPGAWIEREGKGGRIIRRYRPALRPHDLRHVGATWHYAVHRDLLALQMAGGWESLSQVQIYTHLLPAAHAAEVAEWLGLATAPGTRQKFPGATSVPPARRRAATS